MSSYFDKPHLIVTFETTTVAMEYESIFKANSIPGRLIPLPASIQAGCGMCWYAPKSAILQIQNYTDDNRIKLYVF